MKKRDRKDKRKRKNRVSLPVKLLIFAAFTAGLYFFAASSFFDVTSFEVSGNSYYNKDEILIMGNCKTGENIFWGSGCKNIRTRLEKDAYMEEVKVKRILPDKIRIELKERKQVAAVVYGDSYVIIDRGGTVLRKSTVPPKLPLIHGLTISKLEVGQPIEIEQKLNFRQTMEMVDTMEKNDMFFKKIVVSDAEVKAYVLDFGVSGFGTGHNGVGCGRRTSEGNQRPFRYEYRTWNRQNQRRKLYFVQP